MGRATPKRNHTFTPPLLRRVLSIACPALASGTLLDGAPVLTVAKGVAFSDPGAFVLTPRNVASGGGDAATSSAPFALASAPDSIDHIDTTSDNAPAQTVRYQVLADSGTPKQPPMTLTRTVNVADACAESEHNCEVQGGGEYCSVGGACDPPLGQELRLPVFAAKPPVITLLGSGSAVLGPSGEFRGLFTTVIAGTGNYVDPGAVAQDAFGSSLTGNVLVCGDSVVDLSTPTDPSQPWLVQYSVLDSFGNMAPSQYRLVSVTCPSPSAACLNEESGRWICSLDPATCTVAIVLSGASSVGRGAMPSLQLRGLPRIVLKQHTSFSACQPGVYKDCDAGAIATLVDDGDLNDDLLTCPSDGGGLRVQGFSSFASCGVNTSLPGEYHVTYGLPFEGAVATVVRSIVVQPQCTDGQQACLDGTCTDSMCDPPDIGDLLDLAAKLAAATPPTMTLLQGVSDAYDGAQLKIKAGSVYEKCPLSSGETSAFPGILPDGTLCELGATATDAADGEISEQVLLCPPDDCALTSCAGHLFSVKTLADCGIVTAEMAIGTTFAVDLVAYDSLGLKSSVQRIVTVVSPCATGHFFCNKTCQPVECAVAKLLDALINPPKRPPDPRVTVQLPAAAFFASLSPPAGMPKTVFLPSGSPAPFSLTPCQNMSQVLSNPTSCAATAVDASSGADLSDQVVVLDVTPCNQSDATAPAGGSSGCLRCSPDMVAAGACLSGVYLWQYTMLTYGVNASLEVHIEERKRYSVRLQFDSLLPNAADAAALAAKLAARRAAPLVAQLLQLWLPVYFVGYNGGLRDVNVVAATSLETPLSPNFLVRLDLDIEIGGVIAIARIQSLLAGAQGGGGVGGRKLKAAVAAQPHAASVLTTAAELPGQRRLLAHFDAAPSLPITEHRVQRDIDVHSFDADDQLVSRPPSSLPTTAAPASGLAMDRMMAATARLVEAVGAVGGAALERADLAVHGQRDASGGTSGVGRRLLQAQGSDAATGLCSGVPSLANANLTQLPSDASSERYTASYEGDIVTTGGVLSVSDASLWNSSCVTPEPQSDDILLAWALSALTDIEAASQQMLTALPVLGDQRDVLNAVQDAQDQADLAQVQAYLAAAQAALAAIQEQTDVATRKSAQQLVAQGELLATEQKLEATKASLYMSHTASLVFMSQLSVALVIEGLGLKADQIALSAQLSRFANCLYVRQSEPEYELLINHYGQAGSNLGRRRELVSTGTNNFDGSNGQHSSLWNGYSTVHGIKYDLSKGGNSDLPRFIGSSGNRVMGGILLHQVRRAPMTYLEWLDSRVCTSRNKRLVHACGLTEAEARGGTEVLGPFGLDPTYAPQSSIFSSFAASDLGNWYNVSRGSPDISFAGTPYGFRHHDVPGLPAGYPVVLEAHLPLLRMEHMLEYLLTGNYLNKDLSLRLTAHMAAFTPDAMVISFWTLSCEWQNSGDITCASRIQALPATSYMGHVEWGKTVWAVLLVVLIVLFVPLALWDGWHSIDMYWDRANAVLTGRRQGRYSRPSGVANGIDGSSGSSDLPVDQYSAFWIVFDALLWCLMAACVVMYFVYADQLASSSNLTSSSFKSYDADLYAASHFLLLRRAPATPAMFDMVSSLYTPCPLCDLSQLGAGLQANASAQEVTQAVQSAAVVNYLRQSSPSSSTTTSSLFADDISLAAAGAGVNCSCPQSDEYLAWATALAHQDAPGTAQRWRLPEDPTHLERAGRMYSELAGLSNIYVTYTFIQSIILMMLILRWLQHLTFHPRLAIIMTTLGHGLPFLLHLFLVVAITIIMIAGMCCVVFGTKIQSLSTFPNAMYVMGLYVITMQDVSNVMATLQETPWPTWLTTTLAYFVTTFIALFFSFVLYYFIVAILIMEFHRERRLAQDSPTVAQDLGVMLASLTRRLTWVGRRGGRGTGSGAYVGQQRVSTILAATVAPPPPPTRWYTTLSQKLMSISTLGSRRVLASLRRSMSSRHGGRSLGRVGDSSSIAAARIHDDSSGSSHGGVLAAHGSIVLGKGGVSSVGSHVFNMGGGRAPPSTLGSWRSDGDQEVSRLDNERRSAPETGRPSAGWLWMRSAAAAPPPADRDRHSLPVVTRSGRASSGWSWLVSAPAKAAAAAAPQPPPLAGAAIGSRTFSRTTSTASQGGLPYALKDAGASVRTTLERGTSTGGTGSRSLKKSGSGSSSLTRGARYLGSSVGSYKLGTADGPLLLPTSSSLTNAASSASAALLIHHTNLSNSHRTLSSTMEATSSSAAGAAPDSSASAGARRHSETVTEGGAGVSPLELSEITADVASSPELPRRYNSGVGSLSGNSNCTDVGTDRWTDVPPDGRVDGRPAGSSVTPALLRASADGGLAGSMAEGVEMDDDEDDDEHLFATGSTLVQPERLLDAIQAVTAMTDEMQQMSDDLQDAVAATAAAAAVIDQLIARRTSRSLRSLSARPSPGSPHHSGSGRGSNCSGTMRSASLTHVRVRADDTAVSNAAGSSASRTAGNLSPMDPRSVDVFWDDEPGDASEPSAVHEQGASGGGIELAMAVIASPSGTPGGTAGGAYGVWNTAAAVGDDDNDDADDYDSHIRLPLAPYLPASSTATVRPSSAGQLSLGSLSLRSNDAPQASVSPLAGTATTPRASSAARLVAAAVSEGPHAVAHVRPPPPLPAGASLPASGSLLRQLNASRRLVPESPHLPPSPESGDASQ